MKRYLVNLTFFAGSDVPEDTDTGLYMFLLNTDEDATYSWFKDIFETVNDMLNDDYNYLEVSYEEGVNINTLMKGIGAYLHDSAKITRVTNDFGKIDNIDNVYYIEQWQ